MNEKVNTVFQKCSCTHAAISTTELYLFSDAGPSEYPEITAI